MENEENTNETEVEKQDSPVEVEETPTEETDESEDTTDESEETLKAELAKKDAEIEKLTNEANKFRRLSQKEKKAPRAPQATPQFSVEETVLLAQGLPEELLTDLKVVSGLRKVSLIKAQNDPIFVAVKEKFEKDQKQKDASLPASRGSGSVKPKKDFMTPNLSREEHMKMVLGK